MSTQYVFFYLMKEEPQDLPKLIPEHIKYWNNDKPAEYSGGPFSDHSGGLIMFKAENMEVANDLVKNDPFITGGVIEEKWLKEWMQQ